MKRIHIRSILLLSLLVITAGYTKQKESAVYGPLPVSSVLMLAPMDTRYNSGEVMVEWNANESIVSLIDIDYSTDGGANWESALENVSASEGSAVLNLFPNERKSFKIKLQRASDNEYSVISNEFEVLGAGLLTLDVSEIDFGLLRTTESETRSIQLSNDGGSRLELTSVDFSSNAFQFSSDLPLTIEPSGTATVNITFSPNTETTYQATASFNYRGSSEPVSVALLGTGFYFPETIDISTSLEFENKQRDKYNSNEYRLLGIPGNSSVYLGNYIGGTVDTNWVAYTLTTTGNYKKYSGSDTDFKCETGRAFWVLHKGDLNIQKNDIANARLNADNIIEIPLQDNRYNFITNPRKETIPWSSVVNLNDLQDSEIQTYNTGTWATSDDFKPYVGYAFDNRSAQKRKLLIPIGTVSGKPAVSRKSQGEWTVSIELTCNDFTDKTMRLGVRQTSLPGLDNSDGYKLDLPFVSSTIFFHREEWDSAYPRFRTDYRPSSDSVEVWDFTVSTREQAKAALTFRGIEQVPGNQAIFLLDKHRRTMVNLRETTAVEFVPAVSENQFAVLVGDEEALLDIKKSLIPREFALHNNYPNPFNPKTAIPLDIPEQSQLSISIYSVLGERIEVLHSGALEPGRHIFHWDGSQYASGTYIVAVRSQTGKLYTKKIALIK